MHSGFLYFRKIRETLHKARLTALHAICLQIFRHIAQIGRASCRERVYVLV